MLDFLYKQKLKISLVILFGFVLFYFCFLEIPDNKLHVYFFDVGQGDGVFIKTPQNHQILIDGGPNSSILEQMGNVLPFFDKTIDLIVLTHPHSDHIIGAIEILKKYHVQNILFTGVNVKDDNYNEFLKEILTQNINVYIAEKNSDFLFGDVMFDVVYPLKTIAFDEYANLNNSSIGIRVIYKNKTIFLTGDMESADEKKLIYDNKNLGAVEILKAGHHGSKTSSSKEFLAIIKPKIAVICVGTNNKFKHPNIETLDNLKLSGVKKTLRTDEEGALEFIY